METRSDFGLRRNVCFNFLYISLPLSLCQSSQFEQVLPINQPINQSVSQSIVNNNPGTCHHGSPYSSFWTTKNQALLVILHVPRLINMNWHRYRLEQSRSQRILWLLEELKLPYELEIFHRDKVTHLAPPELKKVHALGKSPVLSITPPGSNDSVIIAESAFIIEYLLDHFSNGSTLLPTRYKEGQEGKVGGETEQWLRFRYFMHYAEGSLMTFMLVALIAARSLSLLFTFRVWC